MRFLGVEARFGVYNSKIGIHILYETEESSSLLEHRSGVALFFCHLAQYRFFAHLLAGYSKYPLRREK